MVRLDGEDAINSLDAVEVVLVVAHNEFAVAEIKDKSRVVEIDDEELEVLEADDDELEEDDARGELPKAEKDNK